MRDDFLKRHIRLLQATGVAACLPALILPDSVPESAITASLVGLALLAALGAVVARRPVVRTPVDLPMLLLLPIALLNLLITVNQGATLPHVTKTVAGVAVAYAAAGLLKETQWFRLTAWALCLLGLALLPYVLFGTDWIGSSKLSWIPYTITKELVSRFEMLARPPEITGFNINLAGGALAMLLPIPLAYALFHRNWGVKLLTGLESVLIGGLLLLTQSRGAMVALLASAAVMLLARSWRWIAVVALIAVGGYLLVDRMDLVSRAPAVDLEADFDSALNSAEGRLELWTRGLYMTEDFPFTGMGMGVVGELLPLRYPTFRVTPSAGLEHLHSLYFNTGAEMGLPGLIVLLAYLGGLMVFTWQGGKRSAVSDQQSRLLPLILGLLGSQVVICVHGITDTIFFAPKAYVIAWALYGVAIAASEQAKAQRS